MKTILLAVCVLALTGCAVFDQESWEHLNDSAKTFVYAYKGKAKIQIGMSKEDVLAQWGKPRGINATAYDKEKGYENWEYFEVDHPSDILFNGTYYHWILRFKNKVLSNVNQEHVSQGPKNLSVFDDPDTPGTDVEAQLKAQGLVK